MLNNCREHGSQLFGRIFESESQVLEVWQAATWSHVEIEITFGSVAFCLVAFGFVVCWNRNHILLGRIWLGRILLGRVGLI